MGTILGPKEDPDLFYVDEKVKAAYKKWINYLTNRVNTYSGLVYKDDPAIFAWNLINEPALAKGFDEARGVAPGTTLSEWVSEMAAFTKQPAQDPNHLLSVGDVRCIVWFAGRSRH